MIYFLFLSGCSLNIVLKWKGSCQEEPDDPAGPQRRLARIVWDPEPLRQLLGDLGGDGSILRKHEAQLLPRGLVGRALWQISLNFKERPAPGKYLVAFPLWIK